MLSSFKKLLLLNSPTQNIALLFFTRSEAEEVVHKPLLPGVAIGKQKAVYQKFISHTQSVLEKTGFPLFIVDSNSQEGNSFGEKLNNALVRVFDQGFDRVIAVGNDCPKISTACILAAAHLLQNNPVVLGPTFSGGIYLLGLAKSVFNQNKTLLPSLGWQSEYLYSDLISLFREIKHHPTVLGFLADINEPEDFTKAWKTHQFSPELIRFFKLLLKPFIRAIVPCFFISSPSYFLSIQSFRGPPVR